MWMILRLQREKAEIQMEARQFKRFAEEKMAHDQQEFGALEELLYKREQSIQALTCEVQAYKHRMMSFGTTESELEGERVASLSRNASVNDGSQFDFPAYDYPPLKCNVNEVNGPDGDFEDVIVGQSPRRSKHSRKFCTGSSGSLLSQAREIDAYFTTDTPRLGTSFKNTECISQVENFSNRNVDETSDIGDDTTDRICTIDSIHHGAPHTSFIENKAGIGVCEDSLTTPRDSMDNAENGGPEIKKLYMRLQALEADRESMNQAIISMRTDKAQLVLLREIAQQLCKEMAPEKRAPEKKNNCYGKSFIHWITSFILWRKKARQSKYMFGRSSSNAG
uniref:GTD-binding domain-containing protein n=1 Tax=Kalanchoe fedtschenkoi TaxID=63787 RepID=A0A7N0RHT5_KALFE